MHKNIIMSDIAARKARAQQTRLAREIQNAQKNTDPYVQFKPVSKDNLTWHFTIRGPPTTPFEGGIFHGAIFLPKDFPFSAPDIMFMNENGRCAPGTKLCLTITAYQSYNWAPTTTVEGMVKMIQTFMEEYKQEHSGIGIINVSDDEKRRCAKTSVNYVCPECGAIKDLMLPLPPK